MSHRSPRSAFTAHLPPTRRSVLASALGLVGAGSALALTGCGLWDNWFGTKKVPLPGQREPVLQGQRALSVNEGVGRVLEVAGDVEGLAAGTLLAQQAQPAPLVAIASRELLAERAKQLGLDIELLTAGPQQWPDRPAAAGALYVWDTPLAAAVIPGQLNSANANYVLQTLTRAGQGCIDGHFAGMITAPVHKGVINGDLAEVSFAQKINA